MTPELRESLAILSPTQQEAVNWDEGACLVLAGPGVGKTTVLTTRLARILQSTEGRNFRILALTFTTKAGDEMRQRVERMVPGLTDRAVIGTFHSFCANVLRQHGSHLGIKPDFGIYDQDEDRAELLRDALADANGRGEPVVPDDARWLPAIDRLRSNLISPEKTQRHFQDKSEGSRVSRIYGIYENALRDRNSMDFNGMILDTCRLAHNVPAVAARVRQTYPYWLVDEFQDTTPAQYRLLRFLAGDEFQNLFVVADDDQIIYQWAGASYRQIASFREHFSPALIQLVENRRCPPEIVQAANNLIAHNSERTPGKAPLVSTLPSSGRAIDHRTFATDSAEANAVAVEFASYDPSTRGQTAVLGRTRAILKPALDALRKSDVVASIATRRDRFVSPQLVWLQACLELAVRPSDKQIFATMVTAANRIAGVGMDAPIMAAEAASSGSSYLEFWAVSGRDSEDNDVLSRLADYGYRLVQNRSEWRSVVSGALKWLPSTAPKTEGVVTDAEEDRSAWKVAERAIRAEYGRQPELDELLQGIALRPKEPPVDPEAVRLLTIHGAKGLEFTHVWILGAAESILPSWQSLKHGAPPAALEEERRNFFVAITRARERLIISSARNYRGWNRSASRFLREMGLPPNDEEES